MQKWISILTLTALTATGLLAQEPDFSAFDRRITNVEKAQRVDADEITKLKTQVAELQKRLAGTAPITNPVSPPTVRQAVGHTHTCRNGHTWDHTIDNGSHVCPTCGESQFVMDAVPKAIVTGGTATTQSGSTTTYTTLPQYQTGWTQTFGYSARSMQSASSFSQGGCSGAGCAVQGRSFQSRPGIVGRIFGR